MTKIYMPVVWKALSQDMSVASTMGYDSDDPHAVTISFRDENKTEWMVSRDLIRDALDTTAGEGDVLCWSTDERFFIVLRNSYASLLLGASLGSIEYFIEQTDTIVPPGDESIDIDYLLERLLS